MLSLLYAETIRATNVFYDTNGVNVPPGVVHENKFGIDIYTSSTNNYDSVIFFGSKLSTKSNWHIRELVIFKVKFTTYIKIVTVDLKNRFTINYYAHEKNKLSNISVDKMLSAMRQFQEMNDIADDFMDRIIRGIPSHPTPGVNRENQLLVIDGHATQTTNSTDLRGSSYDKSIGKTPGSSIQTASNTGIDVDHGDGIRAVSTKASPLPPSSISDLESKNSRLDTKSEHMYQLTGQFRQVKKIEIDAKLPKVVLDSKFGLQGVTMDNQHKDYVLYMVEGGFDPKFHINQISFGPLIIDYTEDHFVSLIVMNEGDRHIEVVSLHNQGLYTMIYSGQNYELDLDIPRCKEIPMPIEGKYMLLDIINPDLTNNNKIVRVDVYPTYLLYNIADNDTIIDVRCRNVDVYLGIEEKERQIHVQMNGRNVYNVTITSVIDGDVIVRSFEKDGSRFVFTDQS